MTPELRTYNFQKPLGGKDSGEVIHLREDTVAVDLGETIVKVSKAEFWDHVRGEVEPLVLGKEYALNALLGGAAFWTPIWESPSWEGPEIVIQDRNKNLKRILVEEFWEYAGFVPSEKDVVYTPWRCRTFLFAEKMKGSYVQYWVDEHAYLPKAPAQVLISPYWVGMDRFKRAFQINTRLPVPSDEVLDVWLDRYLNTAPTKRDLTAIRFGGDADAVVFGAKTEFVIARAHYQAFVARLKQRKEAESLEQKKKEKETPAIDRSSLEYRQYSSSDDCSSGPAYDSNHYESPGGNPGSTGNHGIPGDMTR